MNQDVLKPVTNRDLASAFLALQKKKVPYNTLYAYYDGDQPITYTAERLREIFQNINTRFTQNWCKVVIDSVKDRVRLRGFTYPDKAIQERIDRIFFEGNWETESADAMEGAFVTGESCVVIWGSPEDQTRPMLYANDSRLIAAFRKDDNPREFSFAAKWFVHSDGTLCVYLYYPDHLEYYKSKKKAEEVSSYRALSEYIPEGAESSRPVNPYGRVPVFQFRTNKRMTSELKNVVPLQNGINKLLADMLVAAEYGAFRQRWVISSADVEGKLTNNPNGIIDLPAQEQVGAQATQVGDFAVTELDNYLKAIDNLAHGVGAVSHTPKHYFFSEGGDPSGEALITMESPLVKKAGNYIERWTPVWREAMAFALTIESPEGAIDLRKLSPIWDRPESELPKTSAEVTEIRTRSGVALKTALRWEGKTEAQIEQALKELKEQKAESQKAFTASLLEAERNFNRGDNNLGNRGTGEAEE
jgi:hypothetical protein